MAVDQRRPNGHRDREISGKCEAPENEPSPRQLARNSEPASKCGLMGLYLPLSGLPAVMRAEIHSLNRELVRLLEAHDLESLRSERS